MGTYCLERGAELAELLPCMSAARFQGAGSPASNKKQALAKPPPAPAPVEVLSYPPDPILTLQIPYPNDANRALCAVAKSCLHANGWGAWQYNPATRTWTNLHKDSLPHEPRLNGSIPELLCRTAGFLRRSRAVRRGDRRLTSKLTEADSAYRIPVFPLLLSVATT